MTTKQAKEVLENIFEGTSVKIYSKYPARPPVDFIVITKVDEENDGRQRTSSFIGLFFSKEDIDALEVEILDRIDTFNENFDKVIYIDTIADEQDITTGAQYKIFGKSFSLTIKEAI